MLSNKHTILLTVPTDTDPLGIKPKKRTVGTCPCGREVTIQFDDTECECGRYYNLFGQELVPPSQREYEGDDE